MDERNRTFVSLFVWNNMSARINMRGHAYILPLAECVELRTALDDAIEHIKSEHSDGSRGSCGPLGGFLMDEEREKLSELKSIRIIQLETALKSALAHFTVSSTAWLVVYDGDLSIDDLRALVVATGDVPGFPDTPPNNPMQATGLRPSGADEQSLSSDSSGEGGGSNPPRA